MNPVKKQISGVNFRTMKWLIFQPELLLIILVIFFLSSCSDAYDEVVPFSKKPSEVHIRQHIATDSNAVILKSRASYE